jgi:hypothetical protein
MTLLGARVCQRSWSAVSWLGVDICPVDAGSQLQLLLSGGKCHDQILHRAALPARLPMSLTQTSSWARFGRQDAGQEVLATAHQAQIIVAAHTYDGIFYDQTLAQEIGDELKELVGQGVPLLSRGC